MFQRLLHAQFTLNSSNNKGFTLIEILTTVVIIGILCAMAVPIGQLMIIREQEQNLKDTLTKTREAIDKFHKYYGHYPVFWAELRGESPPTYTITFMREAPPINPFTGDRFDWLVETSGITEWNAVGLYSVELRNLMEHNRHVAEQVASTGLTRCNWPSGIACVGYWGIWNIRYPREDRVAINDTFYLDW
jgi:prepilin-type N-terminal cleavage/methylation domain-containing protein